MKEYIISIPTHRPGEPDSVVVNGEFVGEIIRCKDCRHGEPGACGDGVDCDGVWHNDDWFCADGEKVKE